MKNRPLLKVLIVHSIVSLALLGLSCIGFIFKTYYPTVIIAFGCLGSFINLLTLNLLTKSYNPNNLSQTKFTSLPLVGLLFRYLILILLIGLSTILIWQTKTNNYDYLHILFIGIPYFLIPFSQAFYKDPEPTKLNGSVLFNAKEADSQESSDINQELNLRATLFNKIEQDNLDEEGKSENE